MTNWIRENNNREKNVTSFKIIVIIILLVIITLKNNRCYLVTQHEIESIWLIAKKVQCYSVQI